MNFEMAGEMAEAEGIKVANVVVNDDVAVEDSLTQLVDGVLPDRLYTRLRVLKLKQEEILKKSKP